MLKRYFSISLLLFLLANMAGFYVYFYFRLGQIRQEMRASITDSPEKLQKISLSTAQYENAKKGEDEIEWHGELYDVAKIEVNEGRVTVFALHDEAETNLFAFLNQVVNAATQDDKTPPVSLLHYLSLVFTVPSIVPVAPPSVQSFQPFTLYIFQSSQAFVEITSPPPRS